MGDSKTLSAGLSSGGGTGFVAVSLTPLLYCTLRRWPHVCFMLLSLSGDSNDDSGRLDLPASPIIEVEYRGQLIGAGGGGGGGSLLPSVSEFLSRWVDPKHASMVQQLVVQTDVLAQASAKYRIYVHAILQMILRGPALPLVPVVEPDASVGTAVQPPVLQPPIVWTDESISSFGKPLPQPPVSVESEVPVSSAAFDGTGSTHTPQRKLLKARRTAKPRAVSFGSSAPPTSAETRPGTGSVPMGEIAGISPAALRMLCGSVASVNIFPSDVIAIIEMYCFVVNKCGTASRLVCRPVTFPLPVFVCTGNRSRGPPLPLPLSVRPSSPLNVFILYSPSSRAIAIAIGCDALN